MLDLGYHGFQSVQDPGLHARPGVHLEQFLRELKCTKFPV